MGRLFNIIKNIIDRQNPETLSRPLTADQKTPWTFTAPDNGVLYLAFGFINQRTYVSISRNDEIIGAVAVPASNSVPWAIAQNVYCKKGDVIKVSGLSNNAYLMQGATSFIKMGGTV